MELLVVEAGPSAGGCRQKGRCCGGGGRRRRGCHSGADAVLRFRVIGAVIAVGRVQVRGPAVAVAFHGEFWLWLLHPFFLLASSPLRAAPKPASLSALPVQLKQKHRKRALINGA